MLSCYLQNEKSYRFLEFWHFQMLLTQDSFVQFDLLKFPKKHGRGAKLIKFYQDFTLKQAPQVQI